MANLILCLHNSSLISKHLVSSRLWDAPLLVKMKHCNTKVLLRMQVLKESDACRQTPHSVTHLVNQSKKSSRQFGQINLEKLHSTRHLNQSTISRWIYKSKSFQFLLTTSRLCPREIYLIWHRISRSLSCINLSKPSNNLWVASENKLVSHWQKTCEEVAIWTAST